MEFTYLSGEEIRALDHEAIHTVGIPGVVLMENAAIRSSDIIRREFGPVKDMNITIVCGPGNNGGDGFAVARHLFNAEADVTVLCTSDMSKVEPDSEPGTNMGIIQNLPDIKISKDVCSEPTIYTEQFQESDLVIDAVFGTGLSRDVEGTYAGLINAISENEPVISIDIPSGLDANNGIPLGTAVEADITVTFAAIKKGFKKETSKKYTGKVFPVDISIPRTLY